jgi:hypothetical protein
VQDALAHIKSAVVYAELKPDKDLDPRLHGGTTTPPELGKPLRVAFWSQPVYDGPISSGVVRKLIEKGKADTLEQSLGDRARADLKEILQDFDESLRELSILICSEEDAIKKKLRDDPKRCVLIRTRPPEADPEFRRLGILRMTATPAVGAVWSEAVEAGQSHVQVLWSEWPGMKTLLDERFAMIAERRIRVRRWIEEQYPVRGMDLFG